MRVVLLIVCLLVFHFFSFSQTAVPPQLRAQMTFDRLTDSDGLGRGDVLYGIPLPPGKTVGDTYLDKKWNVAAIMLYENEKIIEGYPVKYNIADDLVEIKSRHGVKVLESRKIKSMVWVDSITQSRSFFVSARTYHMGGTPLKGLVEVLVDGKSPLFKVTSIVEKGADYNPALHTGSRDTKLLKKVNYYYAENRQLIKISSKKKLLPAFGGYAEELDTYIKTNGLDVDEQRDLVVMFDYYNSKFATEAN